MTQDELLARVAKLSITPETNVVPSELATALMVAIKLHQPIQGIGVWECGQCAGHWDSPAEYPCATIRAIEKELG